MDIVNLLNMKVSFQKTVWAPLSDELTIRNVLDEIKSDKYFNQIMSLRKFISEGHPDEYNIHKKILPAVTFCGAFNGTRKKENLKNYNKILVIDIDKLNSSEFERIKLLLRDDEYVFAFWESPSKNGFKGLVSLNFKFELDKDNIVLSHYAAFRKLHEYFLSKYKVILDESGCDTTRLCFFSYDPNLILKENFNSFPIDKIIIDNSDAKKQSTHEHTLKSVSKKDLLFNPKNKNNPYDRKTIQSIIRYLYKQNVSITDNYEKWYRVALAIANTFTYEIGEKYFFKISKLDKDKFNENNCKNLLLYVYENSKDAISIQTIEYFASKLGYKGKIKREAVLKAANEG